MSTDLAICIVLTLSTSAASGAWIGWFAGRRYEKSKHAMHRMRRRRPLTVNIDYEFAVRALNNAGYTVQSHQERVH